MKEPKDIMFFPNGNTCVFDETGEQIAELQQSWLLLFVKFLEEKGINPDGKIVEMPNGRKAKIFKTDNGYNWTFEVS